MLLDLADVELRIIAEFAGPAGAYGLGRVSRWMMLRKSIWRYKDGTTKLLHRALLSSALDASLTRALKAQNFSRGLLVEMDGVVVTGSIMTQAMLGVVWLNSDVDLLAPRNARTNCIHALLGAGFIGSGVRCTTNTETGSEYIAYAFDNIAGKRAVDLLVGPQDETSSVSWMTELSDLVICASFFDGKKWVIVDPAKSLYGVTETSELNRPSERAYAVRLYRREKFLARGVKFV